MSIHVKKIVVSTCRPSRHKPARG